MDAAATRITASIGSRERESGVERAASDARIAGIALLVTLLSIVVLYGGSSAVAGTRPDDAVDTSSVSAFFGHDALRPFLLQALISVFGSVTFALAFRRYASAWSRTAQADAVVDLGAALVLIEAPVLVVALGLELALVQLVSLGDRTAILPVFMAWDWIDNGTMLWLEFGWMALIGLAGWMTGALPRWLAGLGIAVALLIALFAAPALPLRYPLGTSLVAYGPFMVWMLTAGVYLARGGRRIDAR